MSLFTLLIWFLSALGVLIATVYTGILKKVAKGYRFIKSDSGSDIFAHFSFNMSGHWGSSLSTVQGTQGLDLQEVGFGNVGLRGFWIGGGGGELGWQLSVCSKTLCLLAD